MKERGVSWRPVISITDTFKYLNYNYLSILSIIFFKILILQ